MIAWFYRRKIKWTWWITETSKPGLFKFDSHIPTSRRLTIKHFAFSLIADIEFFAGKKIVTEILPAGQWWNAEDYHQLYLFKNPSGYQCPTHRLHNEFGVVKWSCFIVVEDADADARWGCRGPSRGSTVKDNDEEEVGPNCVWWCSEVGGQWPTWLMMMKA